MVPHGEREKISDLGGVRTRDLRKHATKDSASPNINKMGLAAIISVPVPELTHNWMSARLPTDITGRQSIKFEEIWKS